MQSNKHHIEANNADVEELCGEYCLKMDAQHIDDKESIRSAILLWERSWGREANIWNFEGVLGNKYRMPGLRWLVFGSARNGLRSHVVFVSFPLEQNNRSLVSWENESLKKNICGRGEEPGWEDCGESKSYGSRVMFRVSDCKKKIFAPNPCLSALSFEVYTDLRRRNWLYTGINLEVHGRRGSWEIQCSGEREVLGIGTVGEMKTKPHVLMLDFCDWVLGSTLLRKSCMFAASSQISLERRDWFRIMTWPNQWENESGKLDVGRGERLKIGRAKEQNLHIYCTVSCVSDLSRTEAMRPQRIWNCPRPWTMCLVASTSTWK